MASGGLIIVESPAKARTLSRFLGRRFTVKASMGHIRDLPKSKLGVDIEAGFRPQYINIRGKAEIIKELKEAAKKAKRVYLATDPDREGEAISWHLTELLGLNPDDKIRIEFHEITKESVERALQAPRAVNAHLVDAQQTRRILDRLVGYSLSPLLWQKVRRGLSAGRVQSVAVRLIVDREEEIKAFRPTEYWTVSATLRKATDSASFTAELFSVGGTKVDLPDRASVEKVLAGLQGAQWRVQDVVQKERLRQPAAPFSTSTLQQEAARKLHFTARRTMNIAQQLYEGLDIGPEGSTGLITYMRTDSTRVAAPAVAEARAYIIKEYGDAFLPAEARKTKDQPLSQGAHEAIRPTSVGRHPDAIKQYLTSDQYRLYKLIWERFLASQMAAAVLDVVTADIAAGDYIFRARGQTVRFPGFTVLYRESTDEEAPDQDSDEKAFLPPLTPGEVVTAEKINPAQHFTEPPPRYTEASLVKALEEKGIGRPSTYATIIDTIQERGYVTKVDRHFVPTDLGVAVTQLLREYFPDIVDVAFTAGMEKKLDTVEEGKTPGIAVLEEFYKPFSDTLSRAQAAAPRVQLAGEPTDIKCDVCGRPMVVKYGRYGKFLACSGYPECRHTMPYREPTGARCPVCGGEMVLRRTKKGRNFYGCANYPTCTFTTWNKPTGRSCPKCGSFMVLKKHGAKTVYACANPACDYEEEQTGNDVT